MRKIRPIALCSTAYFSSQNYQLTSKIESPASEVRTPIKEVQLHDHEISVFRLLYAVIKRYYLSIMRMSFKVWLDFLWE